MGVNLQVLHFRVLWTNYRHINLEGARLGSHKRWWKVRLHDAETLPDLINLWDLRKRTWLHSASLALLWEKEFLTLQAGDTKYGLHAAPSCTWSYTGLFLPESFRELGGRSVCVFCLYFIIDKFVESWYILSIILNSPSLCFQYHIIYLLLNRGWRTKTIQLRMNKILGRMAAWLYTHWLLLFSITHKIQTVV